MIFKHISLILLLYYVPLVTLYEYQKPVAIKVLLQRCLRNTFVLNDCNWCRCSANFKYTCDARVCGPVDMFGHFNDAVADINVGMEGHGVWRTKPSACEPGVHYTRGDLLCVCTEEGTWPNPVCRDIFRVLHPVEVVENFQVSESQKCSPTKLYLAGCNVCFCPSTGRIDPSLCTQNECPNNGHLSTRSEDQIQEVYAECSLDHKYTLGCKSCICLRNNRLLCDNCTKTSHCEGRRPNENFIVDCNTCHCDAKGTIYCTFNRCLHSNEEIEILKYSTVKYQTARRPVDDIDCEPGTRYIKDCNMCYCFRMRGKIKKYGCTLKKCHENDTREECVIGDSYKNDCQICHCRVFNGLTMEICESDPSCFTQDVKQDTIVKHKIDNSLRSLTYHKQDCEPTEVYKIGCNTCHCLPDGKTMTCTDQTCKKPKPSISLDIIPVAQRIPSCPKGHSYKIDCNYCFCLPNGNAMCTTIDCDSEN